MSSGVIKRGGSRKTTDTTTTVQGGGTAPVQEDNLGFTGFGGNNNIQEHDDSGQLKRVGVASVRGRMRTGNSRRAVGEVVSKFRELLEKAVKDNPDVRVMTMDGPANSLRLSSLVVAIAVDMEGGDQLVAAFTIVIEGSADRSMPMQDFVCDGKTIQVPLTAGDVFNPNYRNKVLEMVAREFPRASQNNVRCAHGLVLHKELSPDAKDAAERVKELSFYAVEACWRTLDLILGGNLFPSFSFAEFQENDRVNAFIDYRPSNVEDACGLPIRADLCIEVSAQPSVQADKINPEIIGLTRVYGYIELVYRAPEQNYNANNQMVTQRYVPRFNITRVVCDDDSETLGLRLFGIYTATILASNNAWAAPLRPGKGRTRDDEVNLRDITAIGYEVPAYAGETVKGARVPPKEGGVFSERDMVMLIREAVDSDAFSIALHIDECGEMTWMDSVLWLAAAGDPNSVEAVVRELDRLTDNRFSKYFNPSQHRLFYVDPNRIPRGYRVSPLGNNDILDLDTLALLNVIGESDPTTVADYDATYIDSPGRDINGRMAKRVEYQRDILGDNMEIKGYGLRVFASSELILAMDKSLAEMRFNINPTNIFDSTGFGQRGTSVTHLQNTSISQNRLNGVFQSRQNGGGNSFNSGLTWGASRK